MNRPIKFRVWTGVVMEYKIMAGYLGHFYVAGMNEKDSACISEANTIYNEAAQLMQFTGVFDQNGKEIYEGDILSYHPRISGRVDLVGWKYEVVYKNGGFFRVGKNKDRDKLYNESYLVSEGVENYMVAGNIYETNKQEIIQMNPAPITPQGTEAAVCADIARRQLMGINKYGTTVAQNPLELKQWLQHAYEETLDKAVYLKRAIEEMEKNK